MALAHGLWSGIRAFPEVGFAVAEHFYDAAYEMGRHLTAVPRQYDVGDGAQRRFVCIDLNQQPSDAFTFRGKLAAGLQTGPPMIL